MKVDWQMTIQSVLFFALGAVLGAFTNGLFAYTQAPELFKTLGVLVAISGSLLGWSAGWLDQSRNFIKEVEYEKAAFLNDDLAVAQKKLIWRWGIALSSAIMVVGLAVFLPSLRMTSGSYLILWTGSLGFLAVALFSLVSLFRSLLKAVDLKAKLDAFELQELRKLRQRPGEGGLTSGSESASNEKTNLS